MIKKLKKSEHLKINNVLNSLEIVDKDNIKSAIWLSRIAKSIDNSIDIKSILALEKKLAESEYISAQQKIRTEVCEFLCEKDAEGQPVIEDVLNDSGEVVAKKYKILDENLKEVEAKISEEINKNKDKLEALKSKYDENKKALDTYLDEEVEIDYPTISQDVYEKSFKVDIQQIFILEDLITE